MRILTHVFAAPGDQVDINIPGRYLRLIQTTGPIDVVPLDAGREMDQERATSVEAGFATRPLNAFDGVRLKSATAQTIRIAITQGQGEYDRLAGDVNVLGTVPVSGPLTDAQLRASAVPVSGPLTDAQLRASPYRIRQDLPYDTAFVDATARTATSVQVFAAASNTNGAVVRRAQGWSNCATVEKLALIAKATAPTSNVDGDVLAIALMNGTGSGYFFNLDVEWLWVPSGKGLYFWVGGTESQGYRAVNYDLL